MKRKKLPTKPDLGRSRSTIHHALFDLSRLSFDLIDLLVFTSRVGRGDESAPSDATLHRVRESLKEIYNALLDVVDDLRPHAVKHLADPDEAFAPRCSFCDQKKQAGAVIQHRHSYICEECVRLSFKVLVTNASMKKD